jgi:hypothetical protein
VGSTSLTMNYNGDLTETILGKSEIKKNSFLISYCSDDE